MSFTPDGFSSSDATSLIDTAILANNATRAQTLRCRLRATSLAAFTASGTGVGKTLTKSTNGALGTIDSVTVVAGDRIFVDLGTANSGVYTATSVGAAGSPWVLTRTTDFDDANDVKSGTLVYVTEGTLYADTSWQLTTNDTITLDTTSLTWGAYTPNSQTNLTVANLTTGAVTCDFVLAGSGSAFDDLGVNGNLSVGGVVNEAKGADIASASTINLSTAGGNLVDVTGTTTITAITLGAGNERTVRFTGALTLTHGASLVLPTGANITTAAGDFAVFRGYASSVVRCVMYQRASGAALASSSSTYSELAETTNPGAPATGARIWADTSGRPWTTSEDGTPRRIVESSLNYQSVVDGGSYTLYPGKGAARQVEGLFKYNATPLSAVTATVSHSTPGVAPSGGERLTIFSNCGITALTVNFPTNTLVGPNGAASSVVVALAPGGSVTFDYFAGTGWFQTAD